MGLKVHLFQLANDLFQAVGKNLSQLVLVLKSLKDGAEGRAKSINLSENGDMIYVGPGGPLWKSWRTWHRREKMNIRYLKYHKPRAVKTELYL